MYTTTISSRVPASDDRVGPSREDTGIPGHIMMRLRLLMYASVVVVLVGGGLSLMARSQAQTPQSSRPGSDHYPLLTQAAFDRMFAQVSNWGRWGKDDQRGTYNLITPEKRRQAAALVKSGISVSLEHTVIEEKAPDVAWPFQKFNRGNKFVWESVHGGAFLSHIDAGCHMAYKGRLYNGFTKEEVDSEEGCQKLAVDVYKDGFVTRGILIDMALFKGVPWLEPGTPVTLQDIEGWEKKSGIKILSGDAIFLRTGKWARRAKLGPWPVRLGLVGPDAGYHWSVIPWFRAHDVAIIGGDGPVDVRPPLVEEALGLLPVHTAVLAALGGIMLDGLDLEAAAELAAKLNRWEFMMTAAPLAVAGATGAPINVTATF